MSFVGVVTAVTSAITGAVVSVVVELSVVVVVLSVGYQLQNAPPSHHYRRRQ